MEQLNGWSEFGHWIEAIELRGSDGLVARVLPLGGRLVSLRHHDVEMIKGFEKLSDVEADTSYAGVAVGRVTNRIAGAKYGDVHLDRNAGENHIHGGRRSWDKRLWNVQNQTETSIILTLRSPHNDQGYPSMVDVELVYEVRSGAELYVALTVKNSGDRDTVANMTLHPYFDLRGGNGDSIGEVAEYEVYAPTANRILELREDGVPTGEILQVENTRFDLRKPTTFGNCGDLDHYFICDHADESGMHEMVRITTPCNRTLAVLSDQPGFQMYTPTGQSSVAVEPSGYIDAPNHPKFPSIALSPGVARRQRIAYRFA